MDRKGDHAYQNVIEETFEEDKVPLIDGLELFAVWRQVFKMQNAEGDIFSIDIHLLKEANHRLTVKKLAKQFGVSISTISECFCQLKKGKSSIHGCQMN